MTVSKDDHVPLPSLEPPTPEQIRQQSREDARKKIAYILVGTYVLLVIANVALPTTLFMANRPDGSFSMSDLKDLSSAISSILAGLVGILGFVVGYYFKSIDDESGGRKTPKKR